MRLRHLNLAVLASGMALASVVATAAPSSASVSRPLKVVGSGAVYLGNGSAHGSEVFSQGTQRGTLGHGSFDTLTWYGTCGEETAGSCEEGFDATITTKSGTLTVASGRETRSDDVTTYPFTIIRGTGIYEGASGGGVADIDIRDESETTFRLDGTITMQK